jgi:hypothetical protein
MELIGTGILLAIGFYLAPIVITFVGAIFLGIIGIIASIFTSR